jgi:hypothetical protein
MLNKKLKNEIHLNGVRADDLRSSTGAAFFSTNSAGASISG